MRVRLLAEAETEAQAAAQWYEQRKAGLGEEFSNALANALERIEENPYVFARLEPLRTKLEVRRYLLSRFPYLVVYQLTETEALVIAVAHLHRRPNYYSGSQDGHTLTRRASEGTAGMPAHSLAGASG